MAPKVQSSVSYSFCSTCGPSASLELFFQVSPICDFAGLHGFKLLFSRFSINSGKTMVNERKVTVWTHDFLKALFSCCFLRLLRFSGLRNFIKSVYGSGDVATTLFFTRFFNYFLCFCLVSKRASRSVQESFNQPGLP